jgi:nitrate reductase delta subunit
MITLETLASLLRYPDAGYAQRLAASASGDVAPLRAFAAAVGDLPLAVLQERYVDTFDLDPACAPELGWHLFGERYERGEWLAGLRDDLRRVGLDEGAELPDHLVNVLRLLGREDAPRAAELAAFIAPALDALHAELERRASPYRHLLSAARVVLAVEPIEAGGGNRD